MFSKLDLHQTRETHIGYCCLVLECVLSTPDGIDHPVCVHVPVQFEVASLPDLLNGQPLRGYLGNGGFAVRKRCEGISDAG